MAFDEALADRVRDLVCAEPALTEKRMFGGLAFLVNGNMAVSASGQGGLLLRVDPAETVELARRPHAQVAVMRGHEMAGMPSDCQGHVGRLVKRTTRRW